MHDTGKYKGITLLSQVLQLLARVLDARIRTIVASDFGEEHQVLVLHQNSDLNGGGGVDLALEATQCFRYYVADIFRIWLMPLSDTVGEIETFKMAATNVKNITIAIHLMS